MLKRFKKLSIFHTPMFKLSKATSEKKQHIPILQGRKIYQKFCKENSEYFNIYRNEKYILVLGKKNNIFQFYEDEKHTKIFARTNFKFFNI